MVWHRNILTGKDDYDDMVNTWYRTLYSKTAMMCPRLFKAQDGQRHVSKAIVYWSKRLWTAFDFAHLDSAVVKEGNNLVAIYLFEYIDFVIQKFN